MEQIITLFFAGVLVGIITDMSHSAIRNYLNRRQ